MATLGRLKRGSVQIQRAAIKATGSIGARSLMAALVVWALALQGLVQHSPSVALLALRRPPLSDEEFAQYVANTSYVTRYCRFDANASADADADGDADAEAPLEEAEAEEATAAPGNASDDALAADYEEALAALNVTVRRHHPRLPEPSMKVPLSGEEAAEALLREAFLWGALASPLPAALLAGRVGAVRVAGAAGLASGALIALLPLAAPLPPLHFTLRVAQGVASGAIWPALHMLGVNWYPPLQRTGYVSYYATLSLGRAGAGLLGAPLVRLVGSDWLCYVLTCLSVLWFLAWISLVRDTPHQHPRVSDEQRARLHAAIGPTLDAKQARAPVPWRQLLLSAPVWACAVAAMGAQWGQAALQLAVAKYLKLVYGFALTYDRVLAVLPAVGQCLSALLLARVADEARTSLLVSTTTTRKLLVYTSHFPTGAILFVVGYSGCDPTVPAALYTAAVVVSGATAPGVYASAMDLAPNYAGEVFGLTQTLGAAGGLAGSYVVTEALHGSLPGSWRLVFGVAALALGLSAMAFLGFGSGSVQTWNAPPPPSDAQEPPLPLVVIVPPPPDAAAPAPDAAAPDAAAPDAPAQQHISTSESPGPSGESPTLLDEEAKECKGNNDQNDGEKEERHQTQDDPETSVGKINDSRIEAVAADGEDTKPAPTASAATSSGPSDSEASPGERAPSAGHVPGD